MKKYIIPSICINPMIFAMNFLTGSDPNQPTNQVSTADALGNSSSFDDEEDVSPSNGKSFWDE